MMRLPPSTRRRSRGFSLMVVLLMTGVTFLILAAVMNWVGSTGTLSARREEYYSSLSAADAAIEKVIASMALDFGAAAERSDYQGADFSPLDANLATYQGQFASTELTEIANYEFTGPTIGADATYVSKIADRAWTPLSWKYAGFGGQAASYRVVSNARNTNSNNNIVTALRQDVQFASIPVFEYAIFFGAGMDMELNPAHEDFVITGPVHGNANIYCQPHMFSVTYSNTVTACGIVTNAASPLDPTIRTPGLVTFLKERDTGVAPLYLPIGTDNTPTSLLEIIKIPSGGDPPLLAQNRYYNKADLIVLVTATNTIQFIHAGISYNSDITNFLGTTNVFRVPTNSTFYNRRESATIQYVEINVGQIPGSALMTSIAPFFVPTNIYVADLRTNSLGWQPGIRLINASDLTGFPAAGLTIATREPLYVKGDFNAVSPRPASLVADAIYALSGGWDDAVSGLGLNSATTNITINAGVLAGFIPSNGTDYSGGVENFFRLIEDWSGRQFNFSGSLVALFRSQIATAPWKDPTFTIYRPPNRVFSYEANFMNPATLPPGTPHVRAVIRQERAITQANSTL